MAKKTTLNAKNLEALGAKRLAELLMELSTGDAAMKRRLRMELAGEGSSDELAKEIRKRLTTIARSRSFIDWRSVRAIASDLETQRQAIVDKVAKADPGEALELLWRFMALATSIFERCDDGSGTIIEVFHDACEDIGTVAVQGKVEPIVFADRIYDALVVNDYALELSSRLNRQEARRRTVTYVHPAGRPMPCVDGHEFVGAFRVNGERLRAYLSFVPNLVCVRVSAPASVRRCRAPA